MNDILKAIILSIVEGVTEFLPISSTGHLILVNHWIHFKGSFANSFDVIIQLGAILSVVVIYFDKLNPFSLSKNHKEKRDTYGIWFKAMVAFLPSAIFGLLFADIIEEKFFNPLTVSITLLLGGIIIIFLENKRITPKIKSLSSLSYKTAFFIGMFQCLAMIPGTSRSAATIIAAILLGASREVAAEFSFFLAIPTMFAATGYTLLKKGILFSNGELVVLLTGIVVSFVVALGVISFFMNYIKKKDFKLFGYYRIFLGILILSYFFWLK